MVEVNGGVKTGRSCQGAGGLDLNPNGLIIKTAWRRLRKGRSKTHWWPKKGVQEGRRKQEAGSLVSSERSWKHGRFSSETYRLQTLDGVLTDVHAPGLLHLHMAQVLQRHKMESCDTQLLSRGKVRSVGSEAGLSELPLHR